MSGVCTQVKVTPAMRRAGAAALESYRESYADDQLAEAVYIAMKSFELRQSHLGPLVRGDRLLKSNRARGGR